jgi:tetratricopeptide (TPR) repeat protein
LTGRRLALFGCPLLALVLYLPTLRCDFVFDDRGVILMNPLMHDLKDVPRLLASPYWNSPGHRRELYRPLTSASFALDGAISGMRPSWFHGVNAVLHALATLLVTVLALEMSGGRPVAAASAGALFAVHPIHVEAVAGIVGRSEILAALFVLMALLCHRRAIQAARGRVGLWAGAAWLAALCGMFAKESAIVLPALCLLSEAVPAAPGSARRPKAVLYAGYAMCAALYLAARWSVLGGLGAGLPIPFVDNPAAAAGAVDGRLTGLGTLIRYGSLLLWPRHLSADYSYDQIPVVHSVLDPLAVGGLVLAIAVIGGGAWLLRRAPFAGFALLFMAVSASLTTNIVLFIGTLLAERLMYLPSVGLCLLAGWWIGRSKARGAMLLAGTVVALAVALSFGRSYARIPDWADDFSLYRSASNVSPRSARIRFNLGNAYLKASRNREAEDNFRAALAIYPEFQDARVNLGMALVQQGRAQEALGFLEAAAAREVGNADLAVNLGTAYRNLGDAARAEGAFRRALELDPDSSRAWNNLGSIELSRGNVDEAISDLQKAVRLEPRMAVFRLNLGDAFTAASRAGEAAEQFEAAFRLDPTLAEAHRGLGEVALARGDLVAAEREFRIAASSSRPSARAANFLGYILARQGRYPEAAEHYERALTLDPGLSDAHRSLGLLYAQRIGDRERAVAHLRASLRIDPAQPQAQELRRILAQLESKGGG